MSPVFRRIGMKEILYYTCLIIVIILSLYVVFRKKGKRKKVQEYQTPYNKAREKAREDFLKGERDE